MPAAELRGFMNVDRPACARRSFSAAKSGSDMYTSPRTSTSAGGSGILDAQRDRRHRAQVVGDVLADLAVAARRAALEHPVAVDQRDRQSVDLRLGHELEPRIVDPLAREVVAHPLDPCPEVVRRVGVRQRQHRLGVADLLELTDRLRRHALGRRVGRDQLGMIGLEGLELVEQRVVDVVADLGIVEHVIAVAVVLDLAPQLGGALLRVGGFGLAGSAHGCSASFSAAGWIRRSSS